MLHLHMVNSDFNRSAGDSFVNGTFASVFQQAVQMRSSEWNVAVVTMFIFILQIEVNYINMETIKAYMWLPHGTSFSTILFALAVVGICAQGRWHV